jgi:hypothetical protein
MEITKSSREIWMNHNTVVDGFPYYRNEYLTYDTNGILVKHKLSWSIGDPEGKAPPVEPSGPLDYVKKETPESLEKKFMSLRNI